MCNWNNMKSNMDNGTCLELQNQFQSVPNGVLDNDLSDMIETIAEDVQKLSTNSGLSCITNKCRPRSFSYDPDS